ncbi:serine/threonine protein kinase [Fusarium austroafricanum]|uniref:Serine/threonine protein kinase n=1 Tax=Fusarium austroafricanum TaxID=2364996 RepID=A0A8H4P3M6_9HYPO|nr:serine/threonine protein kinase [Fusarium austroafricanum]
MTAHALSIVHARGESFPPGASADRKPSGSPEQAYEALRTSCDRYGIYPCNLLQRKQLQSTTERYRRHLDEEEKRLFNLDFEEIYFHELEDKGTDYRTLMIRNSPSVQDHLHKDGRDPKSRFVFIQAEHSRAPLNCSRDSFSHILSYHQVPPSFIEFISAFGSTHYPTDYHMTGFDSDDTLGRCDSNLINISTLGRSGREHRMQYLLRSVERDFDSNGSRKWNIRQFAVYHSFDLVEGKALWINIKANSVLEDRIKEATADSAILDSAALDDLSNSFAATLLIHLIFIEWCDEDWRTCINDCEGKIRDILAKAQTSQIVQPPEFSTSAKQALGLQKAQTTGPSDREKWPPSGPLAWGREILTHLNSPSRYRHRATEDPEEFRTAGDDGRLHNWQFKNLRNLDTFSFGEVQHLHYLSEQLQSYLLVMDLNHQALRDIAERYRNLPHRRGFPQPLRKDCGEHIDSFVRRVERIRKNLEIRMSQVKSLLASLEDGKTLFDGILQYRNIQIGRIFTESSYGQSQKMERIAYKTEKETISMHVITCVTLAFLPAMFVAAFFQSGVVESGRDDYRKAVLYPYICWLVLPAVLQASLHKLAIMTTLTQLEADFRQWVGSHARPGINGFGKEDKYVSGAQLEHYWRSPGNFSDILRTINPPIFVSFDTIREKFLRVFSILVFISQTATITLFLEEGMNDDKLPLEERNLPLEWPRCFGAAMKDQWQFSPWEFIKHGSDSRRLLPNQILPVRYKEVLTREVWGSAAARIHVVNVDDDCCGPIPQEVVFKVYEGADGKQLYTREAEIYTRLRRFEETSITKCYGSFACKETERRIIILEHASKGSLLDFFDKTQPPVYPSDLEMLWLSLLELLEGLWVLHNPDRNDSGSLVGIHQDIQPANILVFPRNTDSPYDVSFKLADFGLAEIVRGVEGEGATVPTENEGNRMYSAPESYPNYEIQSEARPHVNSLVDLWSLGAVYSDFLAWSIGGPDSRERYRKKRRDAIAKLSHITERGVVACFHDGNKRLPAVEVFHNEILKETKHGDFVSPCMSKFILTFMMVESRERLSALVAKGQAIKEIDEARSGRKPQRPSTPNTGCPTAFQKRPFSFGGERKVSVAEVYEELKKKRNWISFRTHRNQPSEAGMHLPGMQRARNQIDLHGGRDQIFVFDDFDSMREHRRMVTETARVISYSVKVSDKDGMDLYFASDSVHPQKCKSSSDVESKIANKIMASGYCDMRKCLEDVMDRVIKNGMQPTGIYIFTDGVWNPGHDDKVEQVICDAIDLLISTNAKPKRLMFQFIQFGHDTQGTKRLKFLDDGCKRLHRGVEYDIVDTKYCDDHVPKIIIGSISPFNDNDA